ncbi:hypothetical protein IV203_037412 [Nitzschia inconspicua]|uniref:Uncharacterized protein n=1 Tax=Nitzschia inconspicua TaxID=303405 RepID=A0A9K3PYQ8_9STRA|nr:hypothetical protein IV203_037412 [Nitzschia inconspicua]
MVEHKNYGRNSLQSRLERSRRYRSRGGSHNDAVSVGDASVTSIDNASVKLDSIDPTDQSQNDTSVVQDQVGTSFTTTKERAGCEANTAQKTENASQAKDSSFAGIQKPPSRRLRLAHKSYKPKRTSMPQSPPANATVAQGSVCSDDDDRQTNEVEDNGVNTRVASPLKSVDKFPQAELPKKISPVSIQTEVQDLGPDAHQPLRHFPSPKHQVSSPCESMAYQQANAMDEVEENQDHAVVVQRSSTKRVPVSSGGNHGPSALQSWKQREQKECKVEALASPATDPRTRGNRVVVVPKTVQGQPPIMKYGSNNQIRHSFTGSVTQMEKTKPVQTKSSNDWSPTTNLAHKRSPSSSAPVATHLRQNQHSPSYQQRQSFGGNTSSPYHDRTSPSRPADGSMYKNLLKPVRRDRDDNSNPTEKVAFGGVIETPKSVTVSSLLASFDSHQNQPLMPMNSKDPRVRHSLPLPSPLIGSKKTSHASPIQPQRKRDCEQDEPRRQVVVRPSGKSMLESTKVVNAFVNELDDVETVRSNESASHPIGPTQKSLSSPSKGGVAQRYKAVTGRNDADEESQLPVDEERRSSSAKKNNDRTHQYYRAAWRVQTNDFDEERKNQDSTRNDEASLSPRQSVLSSWNQRYKNQVQTSSHSQDMQLDEEPSKPIENQSSQLSIPETKVEAIKHENHEHPETLNGNNTDSGVDSEKVAKESIFSTWQQREKEHKGKLTPSSQAVFSSVSTMYPNEVSSVQEKMNDDVKHQKIEEFDGVVVGGNSEEGEMYGEEAIQETKSIQLSPLKKKTNVQKEIEIFPTTQSKGFNQCEPISSEMYADPHPKPEPSPQDSVDVANETLNADGHSSTASIEAGCDFLSSPSNQPKKNDHNSASHPWNRDAMHSVIQSWQSRSSKMKSGEGSFEEEKNHLQITPQSVRSNEPTVKIPDESSGRVPPFTPSDIIDEKKSDDLSVDEDKILGVKDDEYAVPNRQRTDSSTNPDSDSGLRSSQQLAYDEDSYISNTVSHELFPVPSKSASARSHGSSTVLKHADSEEISLYVEDDLAKKTKALNVLSQIEMKNSQVDDISKPRVMKEVVNNLSTIENISTENHRSMRINPSPKDNKKYRMGYFSDESPAKTPGDPWAKADTKGVHETSTSAASPKVSNTPRRSNDVVDIWAVSSVSEDEIDEDIQFDETDEWLNRDPEVNDEAMEDTSIVSDLIEESNEQTHNSSNPFSKDPLPTHQDTIISDILDGSKTWNLMGDDALAQKQEKKLKDTASIPVLDNPNTWTPSKETHTKMVDDKKNSRHDSNVAFDPFLDEAEEGNKEVVPAELFSPTPDPFMTEESFSPLDWSSPRGTTAQHIGYYSSPDSRLEI